MISYPTAGLLPKGGKPTLSGIYLVDGVEELAIWKVGEEDQAMRFRIENGSFVRVEEVDKIEC